MYAFEKTPTSMQSLDAGMQGKVDKVGPFQSCRWPRPGWEMTTGEVLDISARLSSQNLVID